MMITELSQHSVILEKSWMRKHEVSYHDHNDTISFKLEFCTHIESSGFFFSEQSSSLKSELESTIDIVKLIKILKRSNRHLNEEWRKILKNMKTSLSDIKSKGIVDKDIRDELYEQWKLRQITNLNSIEKDEVIDVFFIEAAPVNTLSR